MKCYENSLFIGFIAYISLEILFGFSVALVPEALKD